VISIMLMRTVQRLVPKMETVPKEIDILQKALAGTLAASNDGMEQLLNLQERLMRVIPSAKGLRTGAEVVLTPCLAVAEVMVWLIAI